jgi:hypothetical protein
MLTRTRIERVFGQLKRRFYMLGSKIRLGLKNIAPFVLACCVLHNIAKQRRVPVPSRVQYEESDDEDEGESESESEEESESDDEGQLAFAERHFDD